MKSARDSKFEIETYYIIESLKMGNRTKFCGQFLLWHIVRLYGMCDGIVVWYKYIHTMVSMNGTMVCYDGMVQTNIPWYNLMVRSMVWFIFENKIRKREWMQAKQITYIKL